MLPTVTNIKTKHFADCKLCSRKYSCDRKETAISKKPGEGRPHHPPAIERHLREMERYRAFLAGQRDKTSSKNGEGAAQYLKAWDQKWAEIISDNKTGRFFEISIVVPNTSVNIIQRSRSFKRKNKRREVYIIAYQVSVGSGSCAFNYVTFPRHVSSFTGLGCLDITGGKHRMNPKSTRLLCFQYLGVHEYLHIIHTMIVHYSLPSCCASLPSWCREVCRIFL